MATCRAIRNLALRKLGVLGAGREPRAADGQDAFDALKALYRSMINAGAFGRLRDVVPLANYTARENERIFRQNDAALEITLPELVANTSCNPRPYDQECACNDTLTDRNSRPPLDCSVVVIVDAFTGITTEFIYDGQVKQWQSIYDLEIDDPAPLSRRDEMGLASLLALSIADQFSSQVSEPTVSAARIFQSGLIHRWSMPARASAGVFM